jgi:hypothetical protein
MFVSEQRAYFAMVCLIVKITFLSPTAIASCPLLSGKFRVHVQDFTSSPF